MGQLYAVVFSHSVKRLLQYFFAELNISYLVRLHSSIQAGVKSEKRKKKKSLLIIEEPTLRKYPAEFSV